VPRSTCERASLPGAVTDGGDVEAEVMRQGGANRAPEVRLRNDAECRTTNPTKRDRADLAGQDDTGARLPALPSRDRDVAWIARIGSSRGDRTDGRQAGSMERLVRDDECATLTRLFVTLDRIEVDDDNRPSKRRIHLGQVSVSASA
jgi:hypothetical protein